MPDYRAYMVDADGQLIGYESMTCANDDVAVEIAKHLSTEHRVEVWSGCRLVSHGGSPRRSIATSALGISSKASPR